MQGPNLVRMGGLTGRTVSALAMIAALGGCHLERSAILPPFGKVTPAEYCPGDTLTASYDFLLTETCRAGADCSGPNIDLTSSPTAFPPQRLTGFVNHLDFAAPAVSPVQVTFVADRATVLIPTTRTTSDGTVINVERSYSNPAVGRASVFAGESRVISHDGMCAGSNPAYAITDLPGPPQTSARVRPTQVCNASGVPTIVSLSGDDATGEWSAPLSMNAGRYRQPRQRARVASPHDRKYLTSVPAAARSPAARRQRRCARALRSHARRDFLRFRTARGFRHDDFATSAFPDCGIGGRRCRRWRSRDVRRRSRSGESTGRPVAITEQRSRQPARDLLHGTGRQGQTRQPSWAPWSSSVRTACA